MLILNCSCGNEIYVSGEETLEAWQCDSCHKWFDIFGYETQAPLQIMPQAEE